MTFISAFRRSVKLDSKNKNSGGKGGGNWREEMRLPKDPDPPAAMVFIDAEYPDPNPSSEERAIAGNAPNGQPNPVNKLYRKVQQHNRKYFANQGRERFGDAFCSKGYDAYNPQPCIGCMAMDSGDKSIKLSEKYAFGFFHLAYYHGHPVFRDDGSLLTRKDSQELVLNYDECVGRDCNYCRILRGMQPFVPQGQKAFPNYNPGQITTVYGRRRYLLIGKNHLSALDGWDSAISSNCGTCRNLLQTEGFMCPYCQNLVIDMQTDPRTIPQIKDAIQNPVHCNTCQKMVIVEESTYCQPCETAGRQSHVNFLTDVVALGCRQGEQTSSTLMLKGFHSIEEYEQIMLSQNPQFRDLLGGKSLRQYIQDNSKPYDFDLVLKPMDLEGQEKRLGYAPGQFTSGSGQRPVAQQSSWNNQQQGQANQQQQGPATFIPPARPNFSR